MMVDSQTNLLYPNKKRQLPTTADQTSDITAERQRLMLLPGLSLGSQQELEQQKEADINQLHMLANQGRRDFSDSDSPRFVSFMPSGGE